MKNEKKLNGFLLIIFMMLLWLPYAAKADILRVKQDGTGDYVLIADALAAASNGDTVLIYPGEYFENLFVSDKQLVIAGASLVDGGPVMTRQTIINGGGNNPCMKLLRMAEGTEVSRLTFKNGHSKYLGGLNYEGGAGIGLASSSVIIRDCVITENFAYRSGGGGVAVLGLCHLTLSGCCIYKNNASVSGGGLFVSGNSTIVFDSLNRNNIYMNYASLGADMNLSKTFAFVDDTIKLDTITVAGGNHHYILRSGTAGEIDPSFHIIYNAYVLDLKDGPIYVSPSGSDENDGLNPENPMKSIRWALYNLRCDTEHTGRIILDEGLYSSSTTGEIYPLFIKNNTSIEGNNSGQSIIDCELEDRIFGSYDTTTRLIALSHMDIRNFYYQEQSGLGGKSFVYVTTSDKLKFTNLSFHGVTNISTSSGMTFNAVDSLFIRNTRFYDIRLARGSIVSNWVFTNQQSYSLFESVLFNDNYSICCPYEPELRYLRALRAGNPGMSFHFINSAILDNIDSSNTPLYVSGGMSISDRAKAWVVNSTIGGNISTSLLGAAIGLVDGAEVSFINSIIYGNTPNQIFTIRGENNLPNTLDFSHSVLQGGVEAILTDGPGHSIFFDETNITTDPQWVGYGDYPYALSSLSPCIDAGTLDLPEGIVLPDKDLAGQPRIYGGKVDMGAYEFNPVGIGPLSPEPQEKKMLIVSPNPVKDRLLIHYQIEDAGYLSIEVYNQSGRMVKKLVDRNETAGKGSFYWNLLDDTGKRISKGTYFIKLKLNNTETSEKVVVM